MSATANGRWKDVGSCHWWRPRAQIISFLISLYTCCLPDLMSVQLPWSETGHWVFGTFRLHELVNLPGWHMEIWKWSSESSNMVETCLIIWQYYWRLFGSPEKYSENIVIFQSQQNKRKSVWPFAELEQPLWAWKTQLENFNLPSDCCGPEDGTPPGTPFSPFNAVGTSLWWKNSRCILTFNFQWFPILSPIFSYTLTL